jgi:hypothetical protein
MSHLTKYSVILSREKRSRSHNAAGVFGEAGLSIPVPYLKAVFAGSLDFARDDTPCRVKYDVGAVTDD